MTESRENSQPTGVTDRLSPTAVVTTLLAKPLPAPGNYKYLNTKYKNEQLGILYAKSEGLEALLSDKVNHLRHTATLNTHVGRQNAKNSLCVRYAQGVLEGKYQDNKIFTGLVEAMVLARDRQERGVGMQNFEYTPALDEFAHQIAIVSPEAYRMMQKSFQLRSHRSLQ
jgi:hypothetical protein